MKNMPLYAAVLCSLTCWGSLSQADEGDVLKNALYVKVGLYSYQPSRYFDRTESLGLFSRGEASSGFYEGGFFVTVWRGLSLGMSLLSKNATVDVNDADYSGNVHLSNNIISFPVRYHIFYGGIILSFGTSMEWMGFEKSYGLSTTVNKDNNGDPGLSGKSSGETWGVGALASLDFRLGRRVSVFIEEWYHFSRSLAGQNTFGDDFYPGGNTFSGGV